MHNELFVQQLDKALSEEKDGVLRLRIEVLRDFVAEMVKTNTRFAQPEPKQATFSGPQPSQLAPSITPNGPGAIVGGEDLVKYTKPKGT